MLSVFCMVLVVFSCFSPMVLQRVLAEQQFTSSLPASNSWVKNTDADTNTTMASKWNLSMPFLNQLKPIILKNMGNKSKGGISIVVGVITPMVLAYQVTGTYQKQTLQK